MLILPTLQPSYVLHLSFARQKSPSGRHSTIGTRYALRYEHNLHGNVNAIAFRFSTFYSHIGIFHFSDKTKQKTGPVPSDAPHTILSEWLTDYLSHNDAINDLKILLGTDALHHSTKDASMVWDEKTTL